MLEIRFLLDIFDNSLGLSILYLSDRIPETYANTM